MTTMVVPFLLVYGVSYFFTEFGPNMTTFVLPSELFPVLQSSLGLRGTLLLAAAADVDPPTGIPRKVPSITLRHSAR